MAVVSDWKVGRGMVPSGAGVEREAEQSWTSGPYVAAVEVQGRLYDWAAGVSGTAIGKDPTGNRNSAGGRGGAGRGITDAG